MGDLRKNEIIIKSCLTFRLLKTFVRKHCYFERREANKHSTNKHIKNERERERERKKERI
jgi:hypothetical protein